MKKIIPDLVDALQSILSMDVKGHQLQDRLQFSQKGRELLEKAQAAINNASDNKDRQK